MYKIVDYSQILITKYEELLHTKDQGWNVSGLHKGPRMKGYWTSQRSRDERLLDYTKDHEWKVTGLHNHMNRKFSWLLKEQDLQDT